VRRLKLKEKVEFLGQLDSAQIVDELKKARVFVLPSFIENSPNSLAEAQLVGTPSVASFAGGVSDMIIHGETGLVYPAGDAEALARQIECIMTDDALAVRLSVNSRRASQKRHAPAAITDNLLKAYAEILKSNTRLDRGALCTDRRIDN
jgi:L-malate glycosyltransferase